MRVKAIVFLILSLLMVAGTQLTMASSELAANVQTDKQWYNTGDNINVYGSVASGEAPLPSAIVAVEVHDPASSPVVVRSVQTNSSGVYSLAFKLPPEALTGSYNIYVSCTHGGVTAFNSTSFQASALSVTIITEKQSYNIGENVTITGSATFNNLKLPQALIAIQVQDPNATPIIMRVLETDSQGIYSLTFQATAGSLLGTYTAFASTTHEGAIATAETSFILTRRTTSADINGDGKVNILDLTLVALAFGSRLGEPRWDPRCDLDGNNVINILDITLVARAWTLTS